MNLEYKHFQYEHEIEEAISQWLESEGIDTLNTKDRTKRNESQAVVVKAEHSSTEDHCLQSDQFWVYDIQTMNVSVSVLTVRQEAIQDVSLSQSHWDTVSKIRLLLSKRLTPLNNLMSYHIAFKMKPTGSSNGIEDGNIETTTMNFECVLKIKQ